MLSYHHSNAQFKMPNDPNVPVIMISAGSGIAPFRAFWQQRMIKHYPKSSAWLYFGCRDVTENMFSDETSKFVQVNLCQRLLFLHQLTHNTTTDCSLNYKFNTRKLQAETWGEHVVYRNCS